MLGEPHFLTAIHLNESEYFPKYFFKIHLYKKNHAQLKPKHVNNFLDICAMLHLPKSFTHTHTTELSKNKAELIFTLIFRLFLCAETCHSFPPVWITNTRWYHTVPEVISAQYCNQVTEAAVSVSLGHMSHFYPDYKCPIRLCISFQASKAALTIQHRQDPFRFVLPPRSLLWSVTTAGSTFRWLLREKKNFSDFTPFLLNQARFLTRRDSVS